MWRWVVRSRGRMVGLVLALALLLSACTPRYGFVRFSLVCLSKQAVGGAGGPRFDPRCQPVGAAAGGDSQSSPAASQAGAGG